MAEVLELTEIQIASMKDMLDGKIRSPGANLAVMGFWKKTKDSQIIGRVTTCVSRPSRFPPHDSNTLLFVQGMIRYPRPVLTEDGEVEIEAGDHQGVWGVQLDAATAAFASDDIVGARIHFNIEGKEKLASGMTRYKYRWARRFDIGVEG